MSDELIFYRRRLSNYTQNGTCPYRWPKVRDDWTMSCWIAQMDFSDQLRALPSLLQCWCASILSSQGAMSHCEVLMRISTECPAAGHLQLDLSDQLRSCWARNLYVLVLFIIGGWVEGVEWADRIDFIQHRRWGMMLMVHRVSRKARKLSIGMLLLEMELVILDILFISMKFRNFWLDSDWGWLSRPFSSWVLWERVDISLDYSINR